MANPTIERLTTVQDTVVTVISSFQAPVAGAVRRAAELADDRLPGLPIEGLADGLPGPREVVDNQFDFAGRLLTTSRDFAVAVIESLDPLTGRWTTTVTAVVSDDGRGDTAASEGGPGDTAAGKGGQSDGPGGDGTADDEGTAA